MAAPTDENLASVHSDEIVHTLGEFPELTKAVREGDLATVSILGSQSLRQHFQCFGVAA
jgi:hypothetical protein